MMFTQNKNIQLNLPGAIFFYAALIIVVSCNSGSNKNNENSLANSSTGDTTLKTIVSSSNDQNSDQSDTTINPNNQTASLQNWYADSMLAQGFSGLLGKNDSGILKNMGSGKNMDSMMQQVQSMLGGKDNNPGDAISKLLINMQLGQLNDDNPLKAVAKGMQEAQENGTAGPAKNYSAIYTSEQAADFKVPVSGNGNTILLQYSGGTISNGKKDGLWKNVLITSNPGQWNVFTEGYVESSTINMKVHASSLANINENYSINLNEQYKKYSKQYRTESGKNEYDVQVQKIGNEKMFGYNCMHVKITYTVKALGQTAHEQNDEWYSTDIPSAEFVSPLIFENHTPAVVKEIIYAGCSGILVKSTMKSSESSYVLQLSSITKKNTPASQFSIPASYQQDKNTVLYDIQ